MQYALNIQTSCHMFVLPWQETQAKSQEDVVCVTTFWYCVVLQTQTKTMIRQENSTHDVKGQDLALPKTFSHPNCASEHVIRNQR